MIKVLPKKGDALVCGAQHSQHLSNCGRRRVNTASFGKRLVAFERRLVRSLRDKQIGTALASSLFRTGYLCGSQWCPCPCNKGRPDVVVVECAASARHLALGRRLPDDLAPNEAASRPPGLHSNQWSSHGVGNCRGCLGRPRHGALDAETCRHDNPNRRIACRPSWFGVGHQEVAPLPARLDPVHRRTPIKLNISLETPAACAS